MTHVIEIAVAFMAGVVAGVIVARLYWADFISKAKSIAADVEKKMG
jgi:hypothetical protein